MPPKARAKSAPVGGTWGPAEAALMNKGFRELHWDPHTTDGRVINTVIKNTISERAPEFDSLKTFFSVNEGGTRPSNNGLYKHYKDIASEYIVLLAKIGIRYERNPTPKGEI